MPSQLPSNVHVSAHPLLRAKLSLLRSRDTDSRETKRLVHDIATIVGVDALRGLEEKAGGEGVSHLGHAYSLTTLATPNITLVPVLRSGLGMVDAIESLLPSPPTIHHLGLFRDPSSLQPVEYYNNLPFTRPNLSSTTDASSSDPLPLAIILDPIIATGNTCTAAIQTLREWGVSRIIVLAVLGSWGGVGRVSEEGGDGVEVWVGGVDGEAEADGGSGLDGRGMIRPGLGDVGDRLFGTVGK